MDLILIVLELLRIVGRDLVVIETILFITFLRTCPMSSIDFTIAFMNSHLILFLGLKQMWDNIEVANTTCAQVIFRNVQCSLSHLLLSKEFHPFLMILI